MKARQSQRRVPASGFVTAADRMRGLAPRDAASLRRVVQLEAGGDHLMSGMLLVALSRLPNPHPEVLRWQGLRALAMGESAAAAGYLNQASALLPGDLTIRIEQASALDRQQCYEAAWASLKAASTLAASPDECFDLSLECDRQGHYEAALAAINRCLQQQPDHAMARLQRVRCSKALGDTEQAAADCRRLIAADQQIAKAWFSLVDLKTVPLTEREREQLASAASRPELSADESLLLDYALGHAEEAVGRFNAALAAFDRANAEASRTERWNSLDFQQQVLAVRTAFERTGAVAEPQGGEIVFLVGLPRAGSTLIEQVLASHSQVEGASELPYLQRVIEEESWRRGSPFPAWVAQTGADDWSRMGQRYLQLSARWRLQKPMSTDKLPQNWLLAGAIRAMLPGSHIVDCRRDALETCWSCYKQRFAPGLAGFSYDMADLATYWRAYDSLCRHWSLQFPAHFRVQSYEALVREPDAEIRALLDFCGLAFETGCLAFQNARRAIRTPSALQVRQPLRSTSTPAARYGALLDPLREQLVGDDCG